MTKILTFKLSISYLLAIAMIILIPHTGFFPMFSYAIPLTVMVWFVLKMTGESFSEIGFSFRRFNIKSVLIGCLSAILFFTFIEYIFFPALQNIIYLPPADLGGFESIRQNTSLYIFIVLMGWLVGGFYEELVFHGFIFTRLQKLIGSKYSIMVSFFITNIIFAFYHLQLGPQGVINAFIAGCAYHALMLKFGGNMWYSFFFHGFFDTIALTYIYLGY